MTSKYTDIIRQDLSLSRITERDPVWCIFQSHPAKRCIQLLETEALSFILSFRKVSLARFYDLKHTIKSMDLDEHNDLLVTVGQDRMVKLWSVKNIL